MEKNLSGIYILYIYISSSSSLNELGEHRLHDNTTNQCLDQASWIGHKSELSADCALPKCMGHIWPYTVLYYVRINSCDTQTN